VLPSGVRRIDEGPHHRCLVFDNDFWPQRRVVEAGLVIRQLKGHDPCQEETSDNTSSDEAGGEGCR